MCAFLCRNQPESIFFYKKSTNEYEHFSKDALAFYFRKTYEFVICCDEWFKKVVRLEDPTLTMKVLGGLYGASVFTSWFCACSLAFGLFNGAFLLSLGYKLKRQELDGLCNKVTGLVLGSLAALESKIPRYVEKVKKN